jgi:hypothetical protein
MIKIRLFVPLGLFIIPAMLASSAIGQDADCEAIMSQLIEAKSQFEVDYKAQKKAFYNWNQYYKELHSMTYEATDEPLAKRAKKCQEGDYLGKDFCKGALDKYNEVSAKEAPAKAELDAAEAKADESKQNYNDLVSQADEQGCNKKE